MGTRNRHGMPHSIQFAVRRRVPEEFQIALNILKDVAQFWQETGTPFYVLFTLKGNGRGVDLESIPILISPLAEEK